MRRLTDAQVDNIARRLADGMGAPVVGSTSATTGSARMAPATLKMKSGKGTSAHF